MENQYDNAIQYKRIVAAASPTSTGKADAFYLEDNRSGTIIQQKQARALSNKTVQKKENNTGLPDNLKSGIEGLSGYSMDDVKVHYNSPQPAQLQAHAYAQGSEIHIAPGQEKHLPHEAWHVVQQKQGRVKPTMQLKAKVNVNDDKGLENEADVMGNKALQMKAISGSRLVSASAAAPVRQLMWIDQGKGIMAWHGLRDGVRWFYNEGNNLMSYRIERPEGIPEKVLAFYQTHQGEQLSHEQWIELMSAEFDVNPEELRDEDDPVFLAPEFLQSKGDEQKVGLAQRITAALKGAGLHPFLGGAAAGTLFTRTREINDLDFRLDRQDRNAFTNAADDALTTRITQAITGAGLKITEVFKFVAVTTIKGAVQGVEISITSEPTTAGTLSRGQMVSGIESIGGFQFLFDKAFAASNRPAQKIESVSTDLFDIIRTRQSLPNNGAGLLGGLDSYFGKAVSKKLIERIDGLILNVKGASEESLANAGVLPATKEAGKAKGQMGRGFNKIVKQLGMPVDELLQELLALRVELANQHKLTVL